MPLIKSISGIRGTIGGVKGKGLTPPDIIKFVTAYSQMVLENNKQPKVVVGRDGRMSGDIVNKLVTATLMSCGIDVVDLGLSTTPTVEMAVVMEKAQGGIILTASHNPKEWNALKLLNALGEFISDEEGKRLLSLADEDFHYPFINELGKYSNKEGYEKFHIAEIMQMELVKKDFIKQKNFNVVVDAINSTGATAVPLLLKELGIKNFEVLNGEITGDFAHNPEPLEKHLVQISDWIKVNKADLGIVVDPDVDRLCFIDENGEMFGEEYTLVAIADYVLQHKKGPAVSNLSSSRALRDICNKHEVDYYASAVGEVNVVEKMKDKNAVIGGEGNGGIIVPELHYGRDALAGIALFMSHLAQKSTTISELKKSYPDYVMIKNKIQLTPEINIDVLLRNIEKEFSNANVNNEDGVKIDFENSWVHLRKSNTEPIIRIYAEGTSKEHCNDLVSLLMDKVNNMMHSS